MAFESKEFEAIQDSDLQSLVDNQVAEAKTVEYKQALPGTNDSDKREFLSDVSSFANAAGGHIVYGIKEKSGVPTGVSGLGNIDSDAEILRLENILRDSVEPRIPGVSLRPVPLSTGTVALIIRIPRSWALPHRVTLQGHGHFYSRNSAGKYRLDVPELRAAFALSETTLERIRAFRTERLAMVMAQEAPVALDDTAKVCLHIVPFSVSDPGSTFSFSPLAQNKRPLIPTYRSGGFSTRYNFDGILSYGQFQDSPSIHSYLQVFRNGSIEAVDSYMISEHNGQRLIPSVAYEKELIEALSGFLSTQRQLGVEPPLFVMLSLLGVAGYGMGGQSAPILWEPGVSNR